MPVKNRQYLAFGTPNRFWTIKNVPKQFLWHCNPIIDIADFGYSIIWPLLLDISNPLISVYFLTCICDQQVITKVEINRVRVKLFLSRVGVVLFIEPKTIKDSKY